MSQQPQKPENVPSEFYKRALELTAHNLAILVRQNWQLWEMVKPHVPVQENGKDLLVQPDSATMVMIFEELGRRLEESALSAVRKDLQGAIELQEQILLGIERLELLCAQSTQSREK